MMPGAERERRLDFNGDAIGRDAVPVVRSMHHEAPSLDRRQAGEARRHPIARGDFLEAERLRRLVPNQSGKPGVDISLIRRVGKMDVDAPQRPAFVNGDGSRIELLGKEIGKPLSVPTIGDEPRDRCGR
jgi:hypothetical protein